MEAKGAIAAIRDAQRANSQLDDSQGVISRRVVGGGKATWTVDGYLQIGQSAEGRIDRYSTRRIARRYGIDE